MSFITVNFVATLLLAARFLLASCLIAIGSGRVRRKEGRDEMERAKRKPKGLKCTTKSN